MTPLLPAEHVGLDDGGVAYVRWLAASHAIFDRFAEVRRALPFARLPCAPTAFAVKTPHFASCFHCLRG